MFCSVLIKCKWKKNADKAPWNDSYVQPQYDTTDNIFFHSYKATGIKNSEIQLDDFSQPITKIVQPEEQFLDNSQVSKFPIYALISDQKSMGTCVAY